MPYDPNANWTSKTNAGAYAPRYFIAFGGLTSKHYSTGPVLSAGTTKKQLLEVPSSLGQKVDQLFGRTSLNLFGFELQNNAAEMNDLFGTERSSPTLDTLINKRVTLYSGYADLAEADYAIVGIGQVRGVQEIDEGAAFRFDLGDLRGAQQDTVLLNANGRGSYIELQLSADFAAGVGRVTTTGDPTGWSAGDRIFLGPSTDGANPGAEEIVTVQQVRDTTNEVFFTPVTAFKYKAGDLVRTGTTLLQGHPLNILLALLTGDFANGSWPLDRALGLPTGVGIASADVDVAGITKERDVAIPGMTMILNVAQPSSLSRLAEDFLYRWLGYPRILLNGQVSFRAFRPPYADDSLVALTEKDILSWESGRAVDLHINRIAIGLDSDPSGGAPAQIVVVEDTADQTLTGEKPELRSEASAFSGVYSGRRLAQGVGATLIRRLGDGPFQIKVKVPLTFRASQIGENVSLTHSKIPNPASASPGLTAKRLEIVERTEDYEPGTVEFLLQDPNYVRPFVIAQDSLVHDYDAASAPEKEYGAIGIDGPTNFGDGGSPYEIV